MNAEIKLGFCVDYNQIEETLPKVIKMGFESVSISGKTPLPGEGMKELSKKVLDIIGDSGVIISSVGTYGNPLSSEEDLKSLKDLIASAVLFHTNIIGTYAGAIPGRPIEESIPVFKKIFSEVAKEAEYYGTKIGFENCLQGGSWRCPVNNIAFHPKVWEMMFHEVPSDALGLEWEPAHQLAQMIKPIKQLKQWAGKIFHVHGKDAHINREYIDLYGVYGADYIAQFCNPGNGDTQWEDIIKILKDHGYNGSISIEQCMDPIYYGNSKEEGFTKAFQYLKVCRNKCMHK